MSALRPTILLLLWVMLAPWGAAWAQVGLPVMERLASYPGGVKAMRQYLQKNIKYPEEARKAGMVGSVMVRFEVDATGKVKNPVVVQSTNKVFDAEAVRVVSTFPAFEPAIQNGNPIAVRAALPINFRIPAPVAPAPAAPVAAAAPAAVPTQPAAKPATKPKAKAKPKPAAKPAPKPAAPEPAPTGLEYVNLPDFGGWSPLVDRRTADFNKLVIRTPEGKALEKSDRYYIFLEIPLTKYASLDEVVNTAIAPSPTRCTDDKITALDQGKKRGLDYKIVLAESPSCQTSGTQPAPRSALVYALKGRQKYYLQYVYYWMPEFPVAARQDWLNFFALSELKYGEQEDDAPAISQEALQDAANTPELRSAYLLLLGPEWPQASVEAKTLGNVRRIYRRNDELKEGCQQLLLVESSSTPQSVSIHLDTIPDKLQQEYKKDYKRVKVSVIEDVFTEASKSLLFRMSCEGSRSDGCRENYQVLAYAQSLNNEYHLALFSYPAKRADRSTEDAWIERLKAGRFVPAE